MNGLRLLMIGMVIGMASVWGCSQEIGDECGSNADCGSDRLCDTSQPGGYCTVSPCTDDTCPSEAVCVKFAPQVSYCMKICYDDTHCRKGYVCVKGYEGMSDAFCNQVLPTTP